MGCDRLGQPMVDRPVLEPAPADASEPEQDARLRGVEDRQAVERRECLDDVEGILAIEIGMSASWRNRRSKSQAPAATIATFESAAATCERTIEAVKSTISSKLVRLPAPLAENRGEGRGRHRGLLGRQHEPEGLHQQKAHGESSPERNPSGKGGRPFPTSLTFTAAVKTVRAPPPAAASQRCQYCLRSAAM